MEKAIDIIKYADLDQLEEYIEYVEMMMDTLAKSHKQDSYLKTEHEILSSRFTVLLEGKK